MHATFTSGAARRRELATLPAGHGAVIIDYGNGYEIRGSTPEKRAVHEAVDARHDRAGRINPILDLLRDEWDGHEAHAIAVEYLFQLARHWSAWQSERIGTFPLDYRDYAGPLTREQSEASGEDRTYWEIEDALTEAERVLRFRGLSLDAIQDYIVHATAVLGRIYEATKEDD